MDGVDARGTAPCARDYNKKWIRNTRITFNLSDANHDGKLNADEFYVFLHPEESGVNAKLVQHLITQDVRDHDKDRDGKLNFTEFFEGMYNELEEHSVVGGGGSRFRSNSCTFSPTHFVGIRTSLKTLSDADKY